MKTLAVIGLILIILLIVAYVYLKNIWDKIRFDFVKGFRGINLGAFNINELILSGQTKINPTLGIVIFNDNNFSIPAKDMSASIAYNGTVIGDTSSALSEKNLIVPANGSLEVTDPINLYLNQDGGKLLLKKIKGEHPELSYTVKLKIKILGMWIPVTYKDSFSW